MGPGLQDKSRSKRNVSAATPADGVLNAGATGSLGTHPDLDNFLRFTRRFTQRPADPTDVSKTTSQKRRRIELNVQEVLPSASNVSGLQRSPA